MATMRSISLAKPLIVMMIGLPGSGKSFFARQFSDTFGAPLLSYDQLMSEMFFDTFGGNKEHKAVTRVISSLIEQLVKTKKTFLIDGGLQTKSDRAAIRSYAKTAGYDVLSIWVQTDVNTCLTRTVKHRNKKNGDTPSAAINEDQFRTLEKRFSTPGLQEHAIVISGKHTYAAQAKAVLKKLAGPEETTTAPTIGKIHSIIVKDEPSDAHVRRSVTIV